jgi:kynurenine formamidase
MIILSKQIHEETITYGNQKSFTTSIIKSKEKGDSCNEVKLDFRLHSSTHVDFPYHFIDNGKKGEDFPYFNRYTGVEVINLIELKSLLYLEESKREVNLHIDCLLLNFKSAEIDSFKRNCGLSLVASHTLLNLYPKLKAIMLNTLSISSLNNRFEGRAVHQFILNKNILIYEDCDFSKITSTPINSINVFHVFGGSLDGSPCIIYID